MYGLEAILPIQCKISSLKLAIELLPDTSEEEVRLLNLIHLDEMRHEDKLGNEAHKRRIKVQYDKNVQPRIYSEGDLVLLYDQEANVIGTRKFEPLWHGPYIVKKVLSKGAYELVDYDGIPLAQPRNGFIWNVTMLNHERSNFLYYIVYMLLICIHYLNIFF